MMGKPKCVVSTVLMGVAMFVLLHMDVSGAIWYNGSPYGFQGLDGVSENPQEKTLRECVIEGAGYFLESYSDYLLFLNKVELAELKGFDWGELRFILERVIEKLEYANDLMGQLKEKAEATPYNQVIIDELLNFDYDAFLEQEKLNESVFKQVKAFLSKGKIREMYGQALLHTRDILFSANVIKERMEEGAFPEISNLHALNETYVQSLLFGKYAAQVFQKIK
jgi:hypothetical protein